MLINIFEVSMSFVNLIVWFDVNLDNLLLWENPIFLQIKKDWNLPIPKILVKEKWIDLFSGSSVSKIYNIYRLKICIISTNIFTLICIEVRKNSGYNPINIVPKISGKKINISRLLMSI